MTHSIDSTYTTYIVSPRVKVWKALTDGAITREYFFGRRIESSWKVGDGWRIWMHDPMNSSQEIIDSEGEVLECVAGRKLVLSWRVMWMPELRSFPEGRVTYTLDEMGFGVTRLRMDQSHENPVEEHWLEMGRKGWAAIFSSLKTLLETGTPLPPIDMSR